MDDDQWKEVRIWWRIISCEYRTSFQELFVAQKSNRCWADAVIGDNIFSVSSLLHFGHHDANCANLWFPKALVSVNEAQIFVISETELNCRFTRSMYLWYAWRSRQPFWALSKSLVEHPNFLRSLLWMRGIPNTKPMIDPISNPTNLYANLFKLKVVVSLSFRYAFTACRGVLKVNEISRKSMMTEGR